MYNNELKQYSFYDKTTGEIVLTGILSETSVSKRLEKNSNLQAVIGNFSNKDYYFKNNLLQEYTADQKAKKLKIPSPFFYGTWNNETMSWVLDTDTSLLETSIKAERNKLLNETDWTDTLSAKNRLGEELYNSWQIYRQQLRDITTQPGYPQQVTWPQPPQ